MPGCVKMGSRVAVLGVVAAAHVTARQADTQMNPAVAGLHTFRTFQSFRVLNGINPGDIRTVFRRHNPQSALAAFRPKVQIEPTKHYCFPTPAEQLASPDGFRR